MDTQRHSGITFSELGLLKLLLRHVRTKQLSNSFDYSLLLTGKSVVSLYQRSRSPMVFWNSQRGPPSPVQPAQGYAATPPTRMLYPPSPKCFQHSGYPILEQTTGYDSQHIVGEIVQDIHKKLLFPEVPI